MLEVAEVFSNDFKMEQIVQDNQYSEQYSEQGSKKT